MPAKLKTQLPALAEDREPWDRQPGEPKGKYYFFTIYRDLLPHERSARRVAEIVNRSTATVDSYCWTWRWVDRSDAWDASLDLERRAVARQAILDMEARHAQMASLILSKVAQRLVGDPAADVQALDPGRLTASDIARLAEVATKVERIARGAEKDEYDLSDGVKLKVAFDFNPQYPDKPEEGVELPPGDFVELEGVDTES